MRETILAGLAWILLAVGVSTADSERILIPFILALTGAVLLLRVCRK